MSVKKFEIELWEADAIVLFDWLETVELGGVDQVPITRAQKQALTDLHARLEETDARDATKEQIKAAEEAVTEHMGWE